MNRQDFEHATAELQALDAAHHLHPFSDARLLESHGVRVITEADGVMLTDSQGKRYLDAMAGLWCVNIGYGRPEMARVAAHQMQKLSYYNTFFQTSHPPAIDLAKRLAALTPGHLSHVFFANSGSEANDTNIRLARHYWTCIGKPNKTVIISRKNAYHGSTLGAASLGGMTAMHRQGGLPIPDIVHIDQPDWYGEGGDGDRAEFGLERARQLEKKIDALGEDRVAAFIAEPIQGAGGVIIPPESYWPEISRICRERDILLIADEVICGFGRTGQWFGSQTFDIRPDIMTLAKGLSSGYMPIAASMVSGEIAAGIAGEGDFNHGYTWSGHPVACAVALENLRLMEEENLLTYVQRTAAPYLREKWRQLENHKLVGEAVICGMIGSLALTPDKRARAPFDRLSGQAGLYCRQRCVENGLIMRHVGDRMIISPPLIIKPEEIDVLIERAVKSLDETWTWLKAQGAVGN